MGTSAAAALGCEPWSAASRANPTESNAGPLPVSSIFTGVSGQVHGCPGSPLNLSGGPSTLKLHID